jgi:hypothetical protein
LGKKQTRGRPEFEATAALKRKVANAAGGGMSHEEIALGLGISRKTLEKHFDHELSVGAYAKRLEVLDAMQRTAKRGNVAAQKAYLQLTPHLAAPPYEGAQSDEKPPAAEKLGKKDQAEADAVTAQDGSQWDGLLPRAPGIH